MNPRLVNVPNVCPEIILIVGPSRSGTTALARSFTEAKIPAIHELTKMTRTIRRNENSDFVFTIPDAEDDNIPKIVIKESIGGRNQEFCRYNPLSALLNSGIPQEKIHLVTMMREPLANITSLFEILSEALLVAPKNGFSQEVREIIISNAVTSFKTVRQVRKEAIAIGIPTTTLTYEALQYNEPEIVTSSLLQKVGIQPPDALGKEWENLRPIDDPESGFIFLAPLDHTFHHTLEQSDGLRYYGKNMDWIGQKLSLDEANLVESEGIYDLYEVFRKGCSEDLKLFIPPSHELSEFRRLFDRETGMGRRGKEI